MMKIAFYAPLKPPTHPVASGDREMARLLIEALTLAGHDVTLASELRVFLNTRGRAEEAALRNAARQQVNGMQRLWRKSPARKPELWLTYHPYYKSPDWLGPELSTLFNIPYVTVEASWAAKRCTGPWSHAQDDVKQAITQAAANLYMTAEDREGLIDAIGAAEKLVHLPPFLDVNRFPQPAGRTSRPVRILAVAMMRDGVKLHSYQMLAAALSSLGELDWQLDIIGGGPAEGEVIKAFKSVPAERITWHGAMAPQDLPDRYQAADIFAWPGTGEAYGMVYLEAQLMGLPVVAQNTKGVPAVVAHGRTGLLTGENDTAAYADALRRLILDNDLRVELGSAARAHVMKQHTLTNAAKILDKTVRRAAGHIS